MKQSLAIIFFSLLAFSCSRKMIPSLPDCIAQKIDSIKAQPKWNPPAEINEYEFRSKRVYLITAPCCDRYIELVDENCNYICAPSGGFSGNGDMKCPEFSKEAKHVRLVWKDER